MMSQRCFPKSVQIKSPLAIITLVSREAPVNGGFGIWEVVLSPSHAINGTGDHLFDVHLTASLAVSKTQKAASGSSLPSIRFYRTPSDEFTAQTISLPLSPEVSCLLSTFYPLTFNDAPIG